MALREVTLSDLGQLPPRDPAGHKGTFGSVAVFGGCCLHGRFIPGAPALAAAAAMRAGAGTCVIHAPAPVLPAALAITPSATGVAITTNAEGDYFTGNADVSLSEFNPPCDAAVIGPGLGTGVGARKLVAAALDQRLVPVVLDADGLNCIPLLYELTLPSACPLVVTPHPGEFQRLASILDIQADAVNESQRPIAAAMLAAKLGCVVVLKGRGTIVSDGTRFYRNTTGTSALATGGSGDVLAGLIGGLIAQFAPKDGSGIELPLLFRLAAIAAHAHGQAADAWCDQQDVSCGMLASDLCGMIPRALESLRSHG